MVAETEIEADMNLELSQVQKFYEGEKIFVTGGTGFIGNLLVEKLLRDCSNISKMYLLLRPKKDKSPEQRLNEMFQDPVFERLKKERPNFMDKITMIIGDIEKPNLGINDSDRKLLEQEVNIIFHIAATVRFTEKLGKAVRLNVQATWDMVNLAQNMPNLKVFLYVSTSYSHCPKANIKEILYESPVSPKRMIEIVNTLNEEELTTLTPHLIGEWPNTYTFTKAIAEKVLEEYGKGLPLVIVRPSMIISTKKEPIEGWINNFYGPVGMAIVCGVGILHAIHVYVNKISDMIPGDLVVNNMIVAASYVGNKLNGNKKENVQFDEINNLSNIPIFHCTAGTENPTSWKKFLNMAKGLCLKWMTIHAVWYYFVICCPNYYLTLFLKFFLETIPAYTVDMVLYFQGKKPKMVKFYDKVNEFHNVIIYFATRDWTFHNNNTQALWKYTNDTDKKLFPFSIKEIDWYIYMDNFAKGLRIYLLKDPLDTLPKALARYQKLKYIHYTVVTIFWLICAYVFYKFLFI